MSLKHYSYVYGECYSIIALLINRDVSNPVYCNTLYIWFLFITLFYFEFREVYHTKRMQHVICIKWSSDNKYILSGSDEMNIRLWKANAAEKLGVVSPTLSSLYHSWFHLHFQLQSVSYLRQLVAYWWSVYQSTAVFCSAVGPPSSILPDLVLWVSCSPWHSHGPAPTSVG